MRQLCIQNTISYWQYS